MPFIKKEKRDYNLEVTKPKPSYITRKNKIEQKTDTSSAHQNTVAEPTTGRTEN
jgi:hypothetical protein